MKPIHIFLIGGLMLLFVWLTLIVEGKNNKSNKGAKKFGKSLVGGKKGIKELTRVGKSIGKGLGFKKDIKAGNRKNKRRKHNRDCVKTANKCQNAAEGDAEKIQLCIDTYSTCMY